MEKIPHRKILIIKSLIKTTLYDDGKYRIPFKSTWEKSNVSSTSKKKLQLTFALHDTLEKHFKHR